MINKFGKFTRQNAEAGNTTVIALVISAAALAGISQMLDSSVLTRKNIAAQDVNNQEKDTPRSAAVIAKSLISRPASVESNLAAFWVSDGIRDNKDRLPYIYPSPYVAGLSGAAAARPTGTAIFKSSVTTGYAGLPFDASTVNTDSIVKVLSLDSGRSTNSNFETVLTNPNYAVSNADFPTVVQRTQSRVTYQLIDCEKEGQKSTTFTGYYCVFAAIESDTYTKDSSGTFTKSATVNKGGVSLGLLPVPPAPVCGSVTSSSNGSGKIVAGQTITTTVSVTGVALGYRLSYLANGGEFASQSSTGNPYTALEWNDVGTTATKTFSFDTSSVKSKMPDGTAFTAQITLVAVDGSKVTCKSPSTQTLSIQNASLCSVSVQAGVHGYIFGAPSYVEKLYDSTQSPDPLACVNKAPAYSGCKVATDMITLPNDASQISLTASIFFVDDSNANIYINGLKVYRAQTDGDFNTVKRVSKDLSTIVKAGKNTVYLGAQNNISYWSVNFKVEGTYRATTCDHRIMTWYWNGSSGSWYTNLAPIRQ